VPKVPTWPLERESILCRFGRKASTLSMHHTCPTSSISSSVSLLFHLETFQCLPIVIISITIITIDSIIINSNRILKDLAFVLTSYALLSIILFVFRPCARSSAYSFLHPFIRPSICRSFHLFICPSFSPSVCSYVLRFISSSMNLFVRSCLSSVRFLFLLPSFLPALLFFILFCLFVSLRY